MRFEFFIWGEFKNEEERLRQKIAKSLRSKPQAFKDYIISNLLRRIEENFDSLEFGYSLALIQTKGRIDLNIPLSLKEIYKPALKLQIGGFGILSASRQR